MRGSVYHHFPGGRAQLVVVVEEEEEAAAAVDVAGGSVARVIEGMGDATRLQAFDAFLYTWRANLQASDFRAGCPVLAVAIEANDDAPQLTAAAARARAATARRRRT